MFEDIYFKRKKVNLDKLCDYGFILKNEVYIYSTLILDNEFELLVFIDKNERVVTHVYDFQSKDEYTLYKIDTVLGEFANKVKLEVSNILEDISEKCFEVSVFKSHQAIEIINYVKEKYNSEIEYLWEKFPDNAVSRRNDNKKWYLAILTTSLDKLGLNSKDKVEVIDLREEKEVITEIVNYKTILPGYHMNKKSWYSILLDSELDIEEIKRRIDKSYILASKK